MSAASQDRPLTREEIASVAYAAGALVTFAAQARADGRYGRAGNLERLSMRLAEIAGVAVEPEWLQDFGAALLREPESPATSAPFCICPPGRTVDPSCPSCNPRPRRSLRRRP